MFAIAEIKGHQYKVAQGDKLQISRLPSAKEGDKVKFDEVLLIADKDVTVGTPFVSGAYIEVKILGELKDKKIRVFKMKPKKRYRRTQGHRQMYTEVEVVAISATGGAMPAPKQAVSEKVKEEAPISSAKEPTTEAKAKTPAKKVTPKKETATKKPVAKKSKE